MNAGVTVLTNGTEVLTVCTASVFSVVSDAQINDADVVATLYRHGNDTWTPVDQWNMGYDPAISMYRGDSSPISQLGDYKVVIGAERAFYDDVLSGDYTFTVSLSEAGPLAIENESLPPGMEMVPYSTTLQATNGTPPYTWSMAEGYSEQSAANSFSSNGVAQGWQADDNTWNLALPFAFPFVVANVVPFGISFVRNSVRTA